jgi:hypothetical protein
MMTSIGESLFRLFLVRETLGKMNSMFYEDYTLLWRRSTRSLLDTKKQFYAYVAIDYNIKNSNFKCFGI